MVMIVIPPIVLELLKDTAIWVGPVIGKAAVAKYTKDALDGVNTKLGEIWARLRGKNSKAANALQALEEKQNLDALSDLQTYLRDAMEDDPDLQKLVEELAQELEAAKENAIPAQKQEMTVESGGTGYQSQSTGTTFVGGTHTHHHGADQH
ncbi:hypothetical protein PN441_12530 [Spirulina major CS-329]|uniref:hypothetical protein n=1 Tax=Spirulina TaxID=1154 RepID=UPI00232E1884|nr:MULTISPECIES: hypothetical protein [Spirulina]MDB9494776.1 hypothetical protein [Spirulina subsalsa CS-330]MDB9503898.1 hypothetical protein [Spirulina major CS-329]